MLSPVEKAAFYAIAVILLLAMFAVVACVVILLSHTFDASIPQVRLASS